MTVLSFAGTMLFPVLIGIYTVNFGRWMWRNRHIAGAVGAWVIAAVSVGISAWVYIRGHIG